MKQTIIGSSMPTAMICINKSKLKVYNKETTPTFYLEKGQEFQIELYNPTSDVILTKIKLNGKEISQGGLVLRPAERVFLERYIDVANKFKFDTYEVANTSESIKAIEDNGDFSVEFYKEWIPRYYPINRTYTSNPLIINCGSNINSSNINYLNTSSAPFYGDISYTTTTNASFGSTISNYNSTLTSTSSLGSTLSRSAEPIKSLKTIETGRVEEGSSSNQKLKTVNKTFELYPFHSLEYKLLPISQKINTVDTINVKRYCTKCGRKYGKTDNFCGGCGNKL
jgi:hypothetical protein